MMEASDPTKRSPCGAPGRAARGLVGAAVAGLLAFASTACLAAEGDDAVQARYLRQRAACELLPPEQDRAACLREAAAARAEELRGTLEGAPAGDYRANALARCNALGGTDRRDCISRMTGGGTTSGSVEAGGILREFVTKEIAPAPQR